MSKNLYANLCWLPPPPADFRLRCRSLVEQPDPLGDHIQALASYSLDANQLHSLARAIAKAREAGRSFAPLIPFRLGLLSNSTVDYIVPALVASAARHGIALECSHGDYNQVVQEALNPDSVLSRADPDGVLVAVDFRGLPFCSAPGSTEIAEANAAAVLEHLEMIRSGIKKNTKAICILQTLAPPPEPLFGSYDRVLPGTPASAIDQYNRAIAVGVRGTDDVLLDLAGLASTVGLAEWHSPTQWNLAKLPFANSFLPLYTDHVTRILAALREKSRRCLILDLDNTLWGGVIGDDGLEGIQLAEGDPVGEAYLSVQRLALTLRERGIVLAVCSKNEDATARLPFRNHPEMLLREDHIAVFQANWNDKAANIKAIADSLSLGLESVVFLDDNPVEREYVRRTLPQVAVPELPDDAALYARTLSAAGYFESVVFSDEDRKRAQFYLDNSRRVSLKSQAGDLRDYLDSLNMEVTFQPFDERGRSRITQLINKSNQFNLTTRRYTEAEVAEAERDPACFTLQVRLSDSFGDNGMISVIVCREKPDAVWFIDTWLMSCRVLGRGVEEVVLREIVEHARRKSISRLIGMFIPTERNRLVEEHYQKLGFTLIKQQSDGTKEYELLVDTVPIKPARLAVRRVGFEGYSPEIETFTAPKFETPSPVLGGGGQH